MMPKEMVGSEDQPTKPHRCVWVLDAIEGRICPKLTKKPGYCPKHLRVYRKMVEDQKREQDGLHDIF